MNEAFHVPSGGFLTTSDLAAHPDFSLGLAAVSPSARRITGPGGVTDVEPRVMQVLVVLAEAAGHVVTRRTLFDRCWGGTYVGDDSLNRTIGAIRKIATEIAGGSFEIETIPRTGYRLNGGVETLGAPTDVAAKANPAARISRRALIGSVAGVAIAGAAGAGLWSMRAEDRRFDELVKRGREAIEYGDSGPESANYLRQAVALRPTDAAAQGLLAYALVANTTNVNKPAPGAIGAVEEADSAARTALKLSSKEPNARLAQIELQRTTLDLAKTEDALRGVLATNPSNIFAMRQLWNLLQSAGRSRDALAVVQRAMTIKPLAATVNFPLAQLLWIIGRVSEADRVIDRALDYWPEHRWVRFARFSIFAFTGRARTALAMLDSDSRPQSFSAESVALWRICLEALDDPSAPNISRTRKATLDATKQNPSLTSQSILTLSALGQVDPAFAIANNFLQFLAPDAEKPAGGRRASSTAWRFTPWLFTPPAAAMRKDPRFNILTDGIGLSAYWSERKLRPDYQIYE